MAAPTSSAPAPTAVPAPAPAKAEAAPAVSNKLFVGNLSFKTRESDLAHAFEEACKCKVYVNHHALIVVLSHAFQSVMLMCNVLMCFKGCQPTLLHVAPALLATGSWRWTQRNLLSMLLLP